MTKINYVSRNEKDNKKAVFDRSNSSVSLMNKSDYDKFKAENKVEEINNTVNNTPEGILTAPKKMYFDLTNDCNLRCITCHNESWRPGIDELDTNQAMNTVLGLREDGVFQIKFSGGEITKRKDWFEIVDFAKDLGFTFGINTNGIYNSHTLDKIVDLNPDDVNISLDGWQRTNDVIRGVGVFDKVIDTIKQLSYYDCNISINSVLSSITSEEDIKELINFGMDYCQSVDFFHVRPLGRAKKNSSIVPSYERINELYQIIEICKGKKDKSKINVPILDGFEVFNIIPNGDMFAGGCVPYVNAIERQKLKLGNIKDEDYTIGNVWANSEKLAEQREKFKKANTKCISCYSHTRSCHGATAEMLVYEKLNNNNNPFCKVNYGIKR